MPCRWCCGGEGSRYPGYRLPLGLTESVIDLTELRLTSLWHVADLPPGDSSRFTFDEGLDDEAGFGVTATCAASMFHVACNM